MFINVMHKTHWHNQDQVNCLKNVASVFLKPERSAPSFYLINQGDLIPLIFPIYTCIFKAEVCMIFVLPKQYALLRRKKKPWKNLMFLSPDNPAAVGLKMFECTWILPTSSHLIVVQPGHTFSCTDQHRATSNITEMLFLWTSLNHVLCTI